MNNKENYKKAIDKIHASEKLKRQTFEKIIEKRKSRFNLKFVYAFASIAIVVSIGSLYTKQIEKNNTSEIPVVSNNQMNEKSDIPRFASLDELKEILKENTRETYKGGAITEGLIVEDALSTTNKAESITQNTGDYSTTNVQVANVDEADIVKTDGDYIYYVKYGKVYIVKADEMKVVSKIEIDENNSRFSPNEIYIKDNKLIVLGNYYEYENQTFQNTVKEILIDSYRVKSKQFAQAIVYDISDKENPEQERVVSIDGNYKNSRMIGDNLYFISNKYSYYYRDIADEEILPICKDTAAVYETKRIAATDIAYFPDTESYSYMLVAGFNINNKEEVNVETFFGASDIIYASENNLYITHMDYSYRDSKTIIYKFNLRDSMIKFSAKGEVEGDLNNQFSMDEYEGNLRIATTSYLEDVTKNQLYILDENLKEIGKIDNMALDEKIYSVRFIGKVGYIVTFKQIDPLFVIDLSNPTNPQIKGELKIPGYSSYLHPYDENHIIGIGYNTKQTSTGGVTNTTLKMSMFDVSDLENPKEMFNVSVGKYNSYSDIIYNHKVLFYNKQKNLIGFPTSIDYTPAFVIYEIDLDEGFKEYGKIEQKSEYYDNIDRAIYIGDILYTLSSTQINSYDLNTFEELKELELE